MCKKTKNKKQNIDRIAFILFFSQKIEFNSLTNITNITNIT